MTQIRVAITSHIRPCAVIFREQPTAPWEDFDYLLLEAYQIMQDETCNQCGHPRWLCRDDSNTFLWSVKEDVCFATQAMKEKQNKQLPDKDREKDKKVIAEWGRSTYVIPKPYDESQKLPTRSQVLGLEFTLN